MNDLQKLHNKKIVLIGGAGFIGHNLAMHLQSLGAKVDIIDGMQVNNLLFFVSHQFIKHIHSYCIFSLMSL